MTMFPTEPKSSLPCRMRGGFSRGTVVGVIVMAAVVAAVVVLVRHQAAMQQAHGPGPGGGSRPGGGAGIGPVPVVVTPVSLGSIPLTLDALGTVAPLATVTVRAQVSGILTDVEFTEGQLVRRGDFLAQIDPRPFQAALAQSQGQAQRDQALLTEAQNELVRYRTLVKEDSIAKQQYDTQAALVQQYAGTLTTDQALITVANLNLAYCHIQAPIDGRVGLRQVDAGNLVQPGDANGLVVITQVKPISVIFSIPEDSLPAVLKRRQDGARLPVAAWNRDDSAVLANGTLTTIDNQIDTTTLTVRLRATFDNATEELFPNQFVNARMLVDTLDQVLVIPVAAVQRGAPGTFVYLISADGTASPRTIVLGPSAGEFSAVTDGLAAGDLVVVQGADKLKEGSKVTMTTLSPGQPSAPTRGKTQPHTGHHGGGSAGGGSGQPGSTGSEGKPAGGSNKRPQATLDTTPTSTPVPGSTEVSPPAPSHHRPDQTPQP